MNILQYSLCWPEPYPEKTPLKLSTSAIEQLPFNITVHLHAVAVVLPTPMSAGNGNCRVQNNSFTEKKPHIAISALGVLNEQVSHSSVCEQLGHVVML